MSDKPEHNYEIVFQHPPPKPAAPATPARTLQTRVDKGTKACPFCGEEILAVAVKCKHCGERILRKNAVTSPYLRDLRARRSSGNPGLRVVGALMFIGGVVALGYFFLFFDTSVAVPTQVIFGQAIGGGRVNNLGLMQDRQLGITVGGIATGLGFVCMLVGEYVNKKT